VEFAVEAKSRAESRTKSRSKNESGAAGNREQPYDSHTNISACNTANHARAESISAAQDEAGSKARRENRIEAYARTPDTVSLVQGWLVRDR